MTNDKITTDNWVIKDDGSDQKDNIPPNVKECVNEIIENAILNNNEETPCQTVTKNDETDKKPEREKKITLDDILLADDHQTSNVDILKKEENNLGQIMETAEENKKEEEKMKSTFNLERKYDKLKSKIKLN